MLSLPSSRVTRTYPLCQVLSLSVGLVVLEMLHKLPFTFFVPSDIRAVTLLKCSHIRPPKNLKPGTNAKGPLMRSDSHAKRFSTAQQLMLPGQGDSGCAWNQPVRWLTSSLTIGVDGLYPFHTLPFAVGTLFRMSNWSPSTSIRPWTILRVLKYDGEPSILPHSRFFVIWSFFSL